MANPLHNEFPPDSIEAKDLKHLLHPTTNLAQHHANGPKVLTRAEGAYIWDNQGNQYLEAMAGLWCTALGYGEEELARVAYEQMKNLSYNQLFAGKTNEASVLLAEKLKAMAPMDAGRVFFGLSGSDANDTQVKLMWYYNNSVGRPEKKKIISRMRGYHGVTVASGSLTGLPPFHKHFDLPIPGILHTDCPHYYRGQAGGESESEFVDRIVGNLESLILKEGPETIAAFIAEPIMGAGGVVVPPAGYYQKVQALLKQHDILFIDDEVICGFGRTGRAFGAETFGIEPDTMSVAKAVSSAYLPLSAVLLPEFMYEAFTAMSAELGNFSHGFTYSGHPVCAAVALKNLELMEERDLFAHAARMGDLMQDRMAELADHPLVGEVRGAGLIGALELVADKETRAAFPASKGVGAYCMGRCEANGLISRAMGDSMALCPPLIITDAQIDEIFSKLEVALNETLAWVG
ncbi:MAG: aminotransferase class III-fold pyridoxal phosphate-dependent enzyme [Gammaproteobacteria bacterium]|jgi:4-aminobutyrate--pyruvate transaminase|nr:MAG: aminotransferase class III-fold pyridoxal phosphate-dependent enzyme [Gammaproteobacteria bacterium]